jgi:hypothetical protein
MKVGKKGLCLHTEIGESLDTVTQKEEGTIKTTGPFGEVGPFKIYLGQRDFHSQVNKGYRATVKKITSFFNVINREVDGRKVCLR